MPNSNQRHDCKECRSWIPWQMLQGEGSIRGETHITAPWMRMGRLYAWLQAERTNCRNEHTIPGLGECLCNQSFQTPETQGVGRAILKHLKGNQHTSHRPSQKMETHLLKGQMWKSPGNLIRIYSYSICLVKERRASNGSVLQPGVGILHLNTPKRTMTYQRVEK